MEKTREDGGSAEERNPLDLLQEDLSYLLAFSDALLELVPDAVAVLDGEFRVRACNGPFREIAGVEPGGETSLSMDHPFLLSEVAPGRTLADALRSLLHDGGARIFRRIGGGKSEGGRREAYTGKAAIWDSGDPESRRLLLWIGRPTAHEDETDLNKPSDRIPPRPAGGGVDVPYGKTPSGLAALPVPLSPEAMTSVERLGLWPPPKARSVLVANRSPWDAVLLSRALREAGLEDITIVESAKEAWEKSDPADYGLAVVVLPEEKGEEMADLCRRLTSYAPTVPVLVLADRAPKARDTLGELPLLGILGKARREENLQLVAEAVFGERNGGEAEDDRDELGAESGADEEMEGTRHSLILLGAGEEGLPVIRRIDAAPDARLALVFDPDEKAPGLARARDLYIPTASHKEAVDIEGPVHAVVVSEEGLERLIAELGLEDVLLLSPADVDGFLADPDEYIGRPTGGPDRSEGEVEDERSFDRDEPEEPVEEEPVDRLEAMPEEPIEDEPVGRHEAMPEESSEEEPVDRLESMPEEPIEDEPVDHLGEVPEAEFEQVPEELLEDDPEERFEDEPLERFEEEPQEWFDDEPEPRPERDEVIAKEEIEETLATLAPEPVPSPTAPPAPSPAPAGEVAGLLDALDLLLDFDRFATRVLDMALDMTGGKTGSLMLIDDETRELRILASNGIPEAVARKTRQRLGEGIAGRVAESGEPLLLQGRVGDQRFRGMGGRPDIQSSVCVPLFSGGKVIGTLSVNCPAGSPVLENKELDRVAELGRQIGGALEQSRQMERSRLRSFELSVRGEIEAIAYSGEDLNRKLSLIADKLVEMLQVDVCTIYLSDTERRVMVLQAASGIGVESVGAYTVPVGRGIVGHVAEERRPLVLRNDSSDVDPVRTYMAVPVLHQTELKGVVGIEDISQGDQDDSRFDLVSSITSSVGLLIGDACAHADSKKKVTMLSAISEMGVAFTAARDRTGLAKLVAFCAATVLESDVATVRLLRPDALPGSEDVTVFDLLATQGTSMPGPDEPLARLDEKMITVIAARGKPCRDRDVRSDEIRPFLEKANTTAVLALPLLSGDDLIGSVIVYRVPGEDRRENGFREHEVEVGVRLADYASAAAIQFLPKENEY